LADQKCWNLDNKVVVRGPDGSLGLVTLSDLNAAQVRGYRCATADEAESVREILRQEMARNPPEPLPWHQKINGEWLALALLVGAGIGAIFAIRYLISTLFYAATRGVEKARREARSHDRE
jgi:hypothetical protein